MIGGWETDKVKELGKRKKLLDFSTASLARELTMQEWEIFKRIAPREFLNQAWQRENKAIIAPNIIRMIGRFNQISYWVATEVLTKQDRKTQVKIIKKFIKTAYICYHLGNFNSMMEILSGLNNISISRLKVRLSLSLSCAVACAVFRVRWCVRFC